MPRRLPKSATEQFVQTLENYEQTVLETGAGGYAQILKTKLIKMYETKGT